MQDFSSKYVLKDQISEDSRTKTYLAWDNELSRTVFCVCLRKRVGETGAREFLLHARMLGQLKHPGLLPIHDMGVLKDSYFYCYRPPPGKTLLGIMKGESKEHQLEAKSKQLILILIQIADTIAYLHEQGVTLGKLDFETVSIGKYGEVIITDWTKSKKIDMAKEPELLLARIREDLKLLASLGLSLWFLDPHLVRLSIREWDAIARDLPLELQIVFDRAYLGRGGIYRSTRDFQLDLNHYFVGKPPVSESNDISFYLKGKFHSHRKAFFLSFALVVACLYALFVQYKPQTKLQNLLAEKSVEHQVEKVSLEPIEEALSAQKQAGLKAEEDLKNIENKLNLLNEKTEAAQSGLDLLNKELNKTKAAIAVGGNNIDNLTIRQELLLKEKLRLQTMVNTSKLEHINSDLKVPELDWVDLSEVLTPRNLTEERSVQMLNAFAQQLSSKESWFYHFLSERNQSPYALSTIPDIKPKSGFSLNSDGTKCAWLDGVKLFVLALNPTPDITQIELIDKIQPRSIVFESNPDFMQILSQSEKAYRVDLKGLTPIWSQAYPWPKPFVQLMPYSPSQTLQFRSFPVNKAYLSSTMKVEQDNTPPVFEVEEIKLSNKSSSEILVSKFGNLFQIKNGALWSSLEDNGPHCVDLPKDLIKIDFAPQDKALSILSATKLEIYYPQVTKTTLGANATRSSLVSLGEWQFPTHLKPLSVLPDPDGTSYWVEFGNGQIFKWSLSEASGKIKRGVEGTPVIVNNENLITYKDKKFLHYHLIEKNSQSVFEESVNATIKPFNSTFPTESLAGKIVGKTWSLDGDPFYLNLSDRHVEVWDREGRKKIAVIAHNLVPLAKVTYSKSDNRIYAMDEKGELLSW